MSNSFRNVHKTVSFSIEIDAARLTIGRRTDAKVQKHIHDPPGDAVHELLVIKRRQLKMQAPNRTCYGPGVVMLLPLGIETVSFEGCVMKRLHKRPTGVADPSGTNQEGTEQGEF
jgi:hypothetical protein